MMKENHGPSGILHKIIYSLLTLTCKAMENELQFLLHP